MCPPLSALRRDANTRALDLSISCAVAYTLRAPRPFASPSSRGSLPQPPPRPRGRTSFRCRWRSVPRVPRVRPRTRRRRCPAIPRPRASRASRTPVQMSGAVLVLVVVVGLVAPAAAQTPEAPARLEPVVVTPTRMEQKAGDAPAAVTVITRDDVTHSASQTVDDLLRQVPGFSLFRRSSSIVGHPTTQGLSLRGIG